MRELRKKTFLTLFSILSMILAIVLVLVNVTVYTREKEGIIHSLNILEDRGSFGSDRPAPPEPEGQRIRPRDLENMMVMDRELYTVELSDGQITDIFCHGNRTEGFDAEAVADSIVSGESGDRMYLGNLYFAGYSYRYRYMDSIVILNNGETMDKLRKLLFISIALFIILEALIIFLSQRMTMWITKPASDAFLRQKEFIADASHELKTPLAVIMASADEMTVRSEEQNKLDNIRYESERMKKLITGMLDLSGLEKGADRESYREEDLTMILEKSALAYDAVAFESGISIETDIKEGLILKCDKDGIEQMISTLLDNAVRHAYPDTAIKVSATGSGGRGGITVRIVNRGDPIPEQDEDKIFERFYRGDRSRDRSDDHYGLGLAIARRIARNHNGDIKAHSENGETTFSIILR